jgi:hypothetical protein
VVLELGRGMPLRLSGRARGRGRGRVGISRMFRRGRMRRLTREVVAVVVVMVGGMVMGRRRASWARR